MRRYKHEVLGSVIKAAIGRRPLTQGEMAAQLGVRQQTVSKWVVGETRPRPSQIPAVAELLGLDPEELHRIAGYMPGQIDPERLAELLAPNAGLEIRLADLERRFAALEDLVERRG